MTKLLATFLLLFSAEVFAMQPSLSIQSFFNSLNKDTMHLVDEFYDKDVDFYDPVTQLKGVDAIRKYYAHQYENLISIQFEFLDVVNEGNSQSATWIMTMRHKAIKSGEPISVPGISYLKRAANGKVIYQRDYFDVGVFVYENIPVLGSLIKFIKSKLSDAK